MVCALQHITKIGLDASGRKKVISTKVRQFVFPDLRSAWRFTKNQEQLEVD